MTDIDDLLDQRMTGGSGDYPPWFDEDNTGQGTPPIKSDGDVLQGRVTKIRDDPFFDPDEEDSPKPILHVQTDEGNVWSTRTHSVLVQLIDDQNVEEGDYVRILKDGSFKTESGQVANDYKLGVIKAEELDEFGSQGSDSGNESTAQTSEPEPEPEPEPEESDDEESEDDGYGLEDMTVSDIESLVQTIDDTATLNEMASEEMTGKNRKTAKAHIKNRIGELEESDDPEPEPEPEETEDSDEEPADVPGDVIEFAESLLSFHGELTLDELDEYLNDTRDFDVDPSDVVGAMDGISFDGETVTEA